MHLEVNSAYIVITYYFLLHVSAHLCHQHKKLVTRENMSKNLSVCTEIST
jgi:hypothetical protein